MTRFNLALIQITLFLTPLLSNAMTCEDLLSAKRTTVEYDGLQQDHINVLNPELERYMNSLIGDLVLPEKVMVYYDPTKGPQYQFDVMYARFPFEDMETGLMKSPEESVAIHLHEYTHQVFETHLISHFLQSKPEVVWAFGTRTDMLGQQSSLDLIEATKKNTDMAKMSTTDLHRRYVEITNKSIRFNEFVADMLPILFYGDPDAIFNSIDFGVDDQHLFRKVNQKLTKGQLKSIKNDEYSFTIISKVFVWQELYSKFKSGALGKITLGEFSRRVINAAVSSFGEMTNNFTSTSTDLDDAVKLNTSLIQNLCREFKIQPCELPQILR